MPSCALRGFLMSAREGIFMKKYKNAVHRMDIWTENPIFA